MDYAAQLALFLLEKTGSVFGCFGGHMPASQQRALFGWSLGKGYIIIDGAAETLCNRVKVCFGHDYDDRNVTKWSAL